MENHVHWTPRLNITLVQGIEWPDDTFYIPMDSVPLVILFCHQSDERIALVSRLSDYLRSQGYTINPENHYHKAAIVCYDEQYSLWEVSEKKGKMICRIMEFPEHYFFDDHLYDYKSFFSDAHIPIRVFMNHIFRIPCTRLWLLMPDLTEYRNEDHKFAYDFYIHWLIDRIYPEQMMCACHEAEVPFAKEIDRYTFDIPTINLDTMDMPTLWKTIMDVIHPQTKKISFWQKLKNAIAQLKP